MRVLFIEPPKDFWFVMGEYLPPPTAALQLAANLEVKRPQDEITVLDCQAERLDWGDMAKRIEAESPHLVAVSSLATCNTYTVARALDTAKKVAPDAFTITGGPAFHRPRRAQPHGIPEYRCHRPGRGGGDPGRGRRRP